MLAAGAPRLDSLLGNFRFVQIEFGQALGTGDDHKEALSYQLSAVSQQSAAKIEKTVFS
jgi:hypothetical protein